MIKDENLDQPFEEIDLRKDIKLWKKYADENIEYMIGHLHKSFNVNEVNGISENFIEETGEFTNINVIESAGCSYDKYVSYMILEIDKSISFKQIKVKFDREKLINKLNKTDFPAKKYIMKEFYGEK